MMDIDLDFNKKIMNIKVEPGACCSNDSDDVKPKIKLNNNVKCENKCFDAVDRWINKAIIKVPTGDNWHRIIQREITLLRVRYPFLTEKQLKGKALVKFGIPCLMGNIIRTGEKKITGALAKELLRTRERKSRIPAAFKVIKKEKSIVKEQNWSPPSKIDDYLEPNSEEKVFKMVGYRFCNPNFSDNKENHCPVTPKKRKIYDSVTATWQEINDDEQTPTKKSKLTPLTSANRRFMIPLARAAREGYVSSPDVSPSKEVKSPNQEEMPFSQTSLGRELVEKLRQRPFGGMLDWEDEKCKFDFDKVSEPEASQDSTSKTSQSQEVYIISPTNTEYEPTKLISQNQENSFPEIDLVSPTITQHEQNPMASQTQKSQAIVLPEYFWPAGQQIRENVSRSEVTSVRRSFERLSVSDDSLITISSIINPSQCESINTIDIISPLTQNSVPSLQSFSSFSYNFDHDYAGSGSSPATPSFVYALMNSQTIPASPACSKQNDQLRPLNLSLKSGPLNLESGKIPSEEIFTPSLLDSQDYLMLKPMLSNSTVASIKNDHLSDGFSDVESESTPPLLSDSCDVYDEEWKKVPPSRLFPPSTDIREKMKSVSMQEIKAQIQGVIDFLDADINTIVHDV